VPFPNPEQMFRQLDESIPDLILLHHHWPGTAIAECLERIAGTAKGTRIIVFTGQRVDVSELIACVRFGVADYWTERGSLDPTVIFRRIDYYCSSSAWTIETLRLASGSVLKLLTQAETSIEKTRELEKSRDDLQAKLSALRSQDARAIKKVAVGIAELVISVFLLTVAFILIIKLTRMPSWIALAFVAIVAVFFLILKGRLAEALFKWGGGTGSAQVKGK